MSIQEREIQLNQPIMPQPPEEKMEAEIRPEKIAEESYWWQAPWGEVKRVTKTRQRELMRQWLESGR